MPRNRLQNLMAIKLPGQIVRFFDQSNQKILVDDHGTCRARSYRWVLVRLGVKVEHLTMFSDRQPEHLAGQMALGRDFLIYQLSVKRRNRLKGLVGTGPIDPVVQREIDAIPDIEMWGPDPDMVMLCERDGVTSTAVTVGQFEPWSAHAHANVENMCTRFVAGIEQYREILSLADSVPETMAFILSAKFTPSGGHAMAISMSMSTTSSRIDFFDPNAGHCFFTDKAQFARFMTDYLPLYASATRWPNKYILWGYEQDAEG
ncbi:MAG: YopT-type cysteine protease domain-containing protein [Myxococcota bacterium]|nr:YopT-type cysteine protease domain-containing protein [Myxococcota bacterium]